MKYFFVSSDIRKTLLTYYVPIGVTRVVRNENDLRLILSKDGVVVGERVANQKIVYFYTSCNFKCELYERRKE